MRIIVLKIFELLRRCAYLWRRADFDEQIGEEAQIHLEMRSMELQSLGVPVSEADAQARREFGPLLRVKEESREAWQFRYLEELANDISYGLRQLRKSPAFTTTAILSLALGIGANTAIFSITEQVLLKTLNVDRPEELRVFSWVAGPGPIRIHNIWGNYDATAAGGHTSTSFSYPVFQRLRSENTAFQDLFAFKDGRVTATINGHAKPALCQLVSGSFYRQLGVQPIAGRRILPSDDTESSEPVAVISYRFWKEHFEQSVGTIGRTIQVNGTPVTIAGVNPQGFGGTRTGSSPDVFLPISLQPKVMPHPRAGSLLGNKEEFWVLVMGRLKAGVNEKQAQAALELTFSQALQETLPANKKESTPHLKLLMGNRGYDTLRNAFSKPLYVLMSIAALILLLACVNLANVLLARAIAREREIVIRAALGAGRMRIVRQVLTESLLLAAIGGLAGVLLGYVLRNVIPGLTHSSWEASPVQSEFDLHVVGFALALSLATGLLFGLVPAWHASREQLNSGVKETSRATAGVRRAMLGKALVSFQVLLSVLLVISAGLFVRTLANLKSGSVGFEPRNILLFSLDPPRQRYPAAPRIRFFHEVEEKLRVLPGVSDVAVSSDALVANDVSTTDFVPDGIPKRPGQAHGAWVNSVGAHFFGTMGIPIVLGRPFNERDTAGSEPVAVINERLAAEYFPHVNPIGRTFNSNHVRIVGVSANSKFADLRSDAPATFYRPYLQEDDVWSMTFEVKTWASIGSMIASVRNEVSKVDKDVPVIDVRTQTEQINATLTQERLFAALTGSFGLLALTLASIGVYGVMAYVVARRASEFGVRMALGAQGWQVLTSILREAASVALLGVTAGLTLALALTRRVGSLLYGLTPHDPLTMAAATSLLFVVTLLAAWIPARRASRIDPVQVLRNE